MIGGKRQGQFIIISGLLVFIMGVGAAFSSMVNVWISATFLVIFALPAVVFLFKSIPRERALLAVLLFMAFPVFMESIGITTGVPYGEFEYTGAMGPKVFGLVPLTAVLVFLPLVAGSVALAQRFTRRPPYVIVLGALLLVASDLVLDPCAVEIGLWVWASPGIYYGVPISNFVGWALVGLFTSSVMHYLASNHEKRALHGGTIIGIFLTISFWTGFSIYSGLLIPGALGLALTVFSLRKILKDFGKGGSGE